VTAAPPSREEIETALRAEVQRLITLGTPSVSLGEGGKITTYWPDAPVLGGVKGQPVSAPSGSASALLAAMFPDAMFRMLTQGLDALEGGISARARVGIVAELEDKIANLENEEESLVEQALAAGLEVFRRSNASGWALLGIARPAVQQQMEAAE
jgi:hypothetical protein